MSLASNLRVPELVAGLDVRTLPLSALEGFVLSRIDGKSSTADIVSLTGLGLDQVLTILDKLVSLGAARYRDAQDSFNPPSATGSGAPHPPDGHPGGSSSQQPRRRLSHGPAPHRRMLSESGVSSAAPETRPQSSRPRTHLDPAVPRAGRSVRPGPNVEATPRAREVPAAAKPPARPASPMFASAPESTLRPPGLPPTSSPRPDAPQPETAISPAQPAVASNALSAPATPASYDPRELDEEVDLPRERRKQILDLYYQLSAFDYYEALGISYKAEKKEIRSAYFALSKAFHPDSMFRKNLGSFKAKMEAVFQFLTEAYETLGKKKTRDEYDSYLRSTKAVRMAERALSFDAAKELAAQELAAQQELLDKVPRPPLVPNIVQPSASTVPLPQAPLPPQREVSAEARKLAQGVIGRRLRGVGMGSPRPPNGVTTPPLSGEDTPSAPRPPGEGQPKTGTHELLARLTRTLRDVGQLTGSNDMVTRAVRASQAAVARGDLTEATQQAARAASLAPERNELKVEHDRLSGMLSDKLAGDYIERAKFEMKHGKWASAALTWSKVCEGRPNDAVAHRQAAHCAAGSAAARCGVRRSTRRRQCSLLLPTSTRVSCLARFISLSA